MFLAERTQADRQRAALRDTARRRSPFPTAYRAVTVGRPDIEMFSPMLADEVRCAVRRGWDGHQIIEPEDLGRWLEEDGIAETTVLTYPGYV